MSLKATRPVRAPMPPHPPREGAIAWAMWWELWRQRMADPRLAEGIEPKGKSS